MINQNGKYTHVRASLRKYLSLNDKHKPECWQGHTQGTRIIIEMFITQWHMVHQSIPQDRHPSKGYHSGTPKKP